MIVHKYDGYELYDQEAVAVDNGVSVRTVRRRCQPVACDAGTRAPLYDPDVAGVVLAGVTPRRARASGHRFAAA